MKIFLISLFLSSINQILAQDYVFFLHNKFIEEYGLTGVHPEYGTCDYQQILDVFKKQGFTVLSEIRPKNTQVNAYADKILKQIDSLVVKGIKPSHITVIGTSKGGYIAQRVSSQVKHEAVNFIFIGSCSKEDVSETSSINFSGNVLSIYESSDVVGQSCADMKNHSKNKVLHFKEIKLNTGLKHGFLFKALPEWTQPSINWARQNYN